MQKQPKDLTGQKFGLLTVVGEGSGRLNKRGYKDRTWICQCECGNVVEKPSVNFAYGKNQSCGCLKHKMVVEHYYELHKKNQIDITGERFGRLTAIEMVEKSPKQGCMWLCRCDCGNEVVRPVKLLRSGGVQSCGCLRDEKIAKVNAKHNKSHSRLYNVWNGMRQRCNDPNHKSYKNYGGRGIKVCDEWDNFEAFEKWALESGYNPDAEYGECTLDRIDVNGDYEPSNCRWVDIQTQAANRRNSVARE